MSRWLRSPRRLAAFSWSKSVSRSSMLFNQPAGHVERGETLLAAAVVRMPRRARRLALPAAGAPRDLRSAGVVGRHDAAGVPALCLHRHGLRPRSDAASGPPRRAHTLARLRRARGAAVAACAVRWSCVAFAATLQATASRSMALPDWIWSQPAGGDPHRDGCPEKEMAITSLPLAPSLIHPGHRRPVGRGGFGSRAALLLRDAGWEVHGLFA